MPLPRRLLTFPLILLVALTVPGGALAQPASPEPDTAVDDHLAWVLAIFDGGAADLTVADVETRFDANFQRLVPPEEFIATIRQLAETFGPLELVEDRSTDASEFVGVFRTASGDYLMISFAVDPASGAMAGFFITPAESPESSEPSASPPVADATPQATPVVAAPVSMDAEAQIALYQETTEAIREVGEPVVAASLAGDGDALAPYLSPEMAAALDQTPIGEVIASYTERQVQMVFAEAGAAFFGQWRGDEITGVMVQGGAPYAFSLKADSSQGSPLPDGRFTGGIPQLRLEIAVEFAPGPEGALAATLDVPAQSIAHVPLANVIYAEERSVGDLVDTRSFAPGAPNNSYTADYAWGDHLLRVVVGVDVETGLATSLQIYPAIPLSAPDGDVAPAQASYRLPLQGTWWVFWGGETELQNYHAVTQSQRYAYDLVIWKDGATWHGDGTSNEDYWAWGQPVVSPVDGTVVDAVSNVEDLPPNAPMATRSQTENPGGNYVVIEASTDEYVVLAHMRQGSVRVDVGDHVRAGDPIGLTGNSGNSTEPHIHIHVQDTPDLLDPDAQGISLRFDVVVDGHIERDVAPVQGSFVAPD